MSSITRSAQDTSIAKLESAGYVFANWFNAHDDNGGQCALMVKTYSRIQHLHAEVDPDGTVNGQTVADYLTTNR